MYVRHASAAAGAAGALGRDAYYICVIALITAVDALQ